MKTLEQIKSDYKSATLDGRDISRLAQFLPYEDWAHFGLSLREGAKPEDVKPIEFTRENVLNQLRGDVAFGFEKALNQRGISSSLMWSVVSMWNWVLEDGLENFSEDDYAQYGLPLFKATALKYGFPNPIGDDSGSEHKYSENG
jgi:hypothetical protein